MSPHTSGMTAIDGPPADSSPSIPPKLAPFAADLMASVSDGRLGK